MVWSARIRTKSDILRMRKGTASSMSPHWCTSTVFHGENNQMTLENYATSCCAVQNMALAAVAEDLYLDWSTGGLT